MATYAPTDINSKSLPAGDGDGYIYDGKLAPGVATATADVLRFCRIPAGTRLALVSINVSTAFGAAAPTQWVLAPIDGSAATEIVAAGDTVLNTVNRKTLAFDPVEVTKDSYLQAVVGTVTTGAAGVASAVAMGMGYGAK